MQCEGWIDLLSLHMATCSWCGPHCLLNDRHFPRPRLHRDEQSISLMCCLLLKNCCAAHEEEFHLMLHAGSQVCPRGGSELQFQHGLSSSNLSGPDWQLAQYFTGPLHYRQPQRRRCSERCCRDICPQQLLHRICRAPKRLSHYCC